MVEATAKDILPSVTRLRGASAGEIAADLRVAKQDVEAVIARLVEEGYLRPLYWGAKLAAIGGAETATANSDESVMDVTPSGLAELRA